MNEKSKAGEARKFFPGLGDLIDLMTVTQLRLKKSGANIEADKQLHKDLKSDITIVLQGLDIDWSSLIERVVYISHLNAEIWDLKDRMSLVEDGSSVYADSLALAHQLNGYRNIIRNDLNKLQGGQSPALVRSNTGSDGLERWIPGVD